MGWIKLDRRVMDHWIWTSEPFSKGQAWIDLILLAEFEDNKQIVRGNLVERRRGEVHRSIAWLAKRWCWSRDKVRRFLRILERDGMCHVNATTRNTSISLENYGFYQDSRLTDDTTDDTTDKTTDKSSGNTTDNTQLRNKRNKRTKEKKRGEPPDRDDWLRQMYLEALREEAEENAKK